MEILETIFKSVIQNDYRAIFLAVVTFSVGTVNFTTNNFQGLLVQSSKPFLLFKSNQVPHSDWRNILTNYNKQNVNGPEDSWGIAFLVGCVLYFIFRCAFS